MQVILLMLKADEKARELMLCIEGVAVKMSQLRFMNEA
jgi:hypothetical protein